MISIALASFNGEKYIREQLDSILNQTIQDFEVVVCDDNSTDNTWSILEEYKKKDKRFRIYSNVENLGFKNNFEKAISLCKGNYVALSDQDDIWTENHLEILVGLIGEKYLVCGNSLLVDECGNSLGYDLSTSVDFIKQPVNKLDLAYRIFLHGNVFQGASMLLSRDFLKIALPLPEKIKYHDAWFAALASIKNKIEYTRDIINMHRRHASNESVLLKKTLINRVKNSYPQSVIYAEKVSYVEAINERIDYNNLSSKQKKIIEEFNWYYGKLPFRKYRLQLAYYRFKNYSKIYSTSSKRYFIPRLVKFIIS